MRYNEIRLHNLKQKILSSKEDMVLSLTYSELDYLRSNNIGRDIIPYIYTIKTKRVLPRLQKVNSIFKEIDLAYHEGKKSLDKSLLPSEVAILKFFEYDVFPIKYRILYPEYT